MTARTGSGDPARTLALLWRDGEQLSAGTRGPKQGLSVELVIRAAIEVADSDGIGKLSMRRVAERLGVSAMSLYTYVPGKDVLTDLMTDAVYVAMERTTSASSLDWRARLEAVARDNLRMYLAHRWLVEVSTSRPPLGPGLIGKYEHELQAVAGIGLSDVEMDSVLTLVLDFVHATARRMTEASETTSQTGLDDEQWWASNAPLLSRVFDPGRYPTAVRVGTAAGEQHRGAYDPAHAFEFGLARVLDGVASLIHP